MVQGGPVCYEKPGLSSLFQYQNQGLSISVITLIVD